MVIMKVCLVCLDVVVGVSRSVLRTVFSLVLSCLIRIQFPSYTGHGQVLERVRQAALNKNKNLAIMLDTKGPEIRTGVFKEGISKIELTKGETLVLTSHYSYKGDNHKLACSYSKLAESVKPGQSILVADGSLVLTVLSCDVATGEVSCRVENNASIGEKKNMNLPGVVVDLPTFTEKDVGTNRPFLTLCMP